VSLPQELQELVDMYASGKQGKRNWFTRRMKKHSAADQGKVWKELERLGHHRPGEGPSQPKQSRSMIIWTEDEWDKLAELVWRMRKNAPSDTLVSLAKRAMSQFPQDRQRNIRVNNELKPLIERLKIQDEQLLKLQDECNSLKARLENTQEAPSRDEILDSLDDEEVYIRFGDRVLAALTPHEVISRYSQEMLLEHVQLPDMAGALVRGLLESWSSQKEDTELTSTLKDLRAAIAANSNKPKMPTPQVRPQATRLPKVTVIGMKSNQMQEVQKRLGDRVNFNFVDKNRKADAIPTSQDVIVLWASFVTHAMQDQAKKAAANGTKLIVHHGGVEKMIKEIEGVLS
jgi:hypothetical protein